ncbi:MAG: class B sortase [Clostridia bacterium]|nr:class B sortase [Clostridia bacterium]
MKNKKKIILTIIQLVFLGLFLFSAFKIYNWYRENQNTKKMIKEVSKAVKVVDTDKGDSYSIDFKYLKEMNSDTVGWIKVPNTDIEFPVVKTDDNDYYLTHSFDKSYNSAGWIFADYRNRIDGTDKNLIIYGHNRRDGSMFESLKNTINEDWYGNINNKYIIFETEGKSFKYEVFSTYRIEEEDYYLTTDFSSTKEYEDFIKELKSRSVNDYKVEINKDDSILTLSTCDNNKNYRIVLHAKKMSE